MSNNYCGIDDHNNNYCGTDEHNNNHCGFDEHNNNHCGFDEHTHKVSRTTAQFHGAADTKMPPSRRVCSLALALRLVVTSASQPPTLLLMYPPYGPPRGPPPPDPPVWPTCNEECGGTTGVVCHSPMAYHEWTLRSKLTHRIHQIECFAHHSPLPPCKPVTLLNGDAQRHSERISS